MKLKCFVLYFHQKSLPYVFFLQSALRIFAFRLCRFPVLMAGSCYPSSFASESALYRLSDACLIRGTGTSNSFSSYSTVEISLDVFLLNLGLAKNSTLPNVVFFYAKSNTFNFRLPSGNMNQLVMNLKPIRDIWLHAMTSNNAVRQLSVVNEYNVECSHLFGDVAKSSKQCFSPFVLPQLFLIKKLVYFPEIVKLVT